jgi:5-methylcytosine-specific restriction enzyme A
VSTKRFLALPPTRRGPEGQRLCRWCGKPVPKGRLEWCSDGCVDDWKVRGGGSWAREVIGKRDKGVCAQCGVDTKRIKAAYMRALRWARKMDPDTWQRMEKVRACFGRRGWDVRRESWWDVDHILEVVNGGGQCGAENLQTLCIRCHKAKTARLVKTRAKARRRAADPQLRLLEIDEELATER